MRHNELSVDELTVGTLIGGGQSNRKSIYLNAAIGSDGNAGTSFEGAVKTLATAYGKIESLKKDVIVFEESASALTLTATFDFAKSLSGIIGTSSSRTYQRCRITSETAMATLLTVSGYGNIFKNFRVMFGTASTTNKTALDITGAGNTFDGCTIIGQDTTTMGQATFHLVKVNNEETTFENCVFGTVNAAMAAGSLVNFPAISNANTVFRNCVFMMNASANAAFFISTVSGIGEGFAIFENCKFINSGTTLTLGIDGAGLGNFQIFLDSQCSFYGVTDITSSGADAYVISGVGNSPTAAEDTLWHIAAPVDHTA